MSTILARSGVGYSGVLGTAAFVLYMGLILLRYGVTDEQKNGKTVYSAYTVSHRFARIRHNSNRAKY
jgi:hypothetical protein